MATAECLWCAWLSHSVPSQSHISITIMPMVSDYLVHTAWLIPLSRIDYIFQLVETSQLLLINDWCILSEQIKTFCIPLTGVWSLIPVDTFSNREWTKQIYWCQQRLIVYTSPIVYHNEHYMFKTTATGQSNRGSKWRELLKPYHQVSLRCLLLFSFISPLHNSWAWPQSASQSINRSITQSNQSIT